MTKLTDEHIIHINRPLSNPCVYRNKDNSLKLLKFKTLHRYRAFSLLQPSVMASFSGGKTVNTPKSTHKWRYGRKG